MIEEALHRENRCTGLDDSGRVPPKSIRQTNSEHMHSNRDAEDSAQAWLHARARLMPDILIKSSPWVRGVFDHSWAPMRALAQQANHLPPHMWSLLLGWDSGYVAIYAEDTHYRPGPASIRRQPVINVAFMSIEDVALGNERPLHVLGHLIDHHLGCAGDVNGHWLSSGGGISPGWRKAGQRLRDLFRLGYAVDPVAQSNVRDYFAQSLALYCHDRQRLNVADPQIFKWLRNTIWNEALWKTDLES